MARPRKYESDAERQSAHRARYAYAALRLKVETMATVDRLAVELDQPRTEVLNSLVNFALLNRNWHALGLFGKALPRADGGPSSGS